MMSGYISTSGERLEKSIWMRFQIIFNIGGVRFGVGDLSTFLTQTVRTAWEVSWRKY